MGKASIGDCFSTDNRTDGGKSSIEKVAIGRYGPVSGRCYHVIDPENSTATCLVTTKKIRCGLLPCGLSWQNVTRKATLPPKAKQHLQKIQPNFGHRFPIWDSNGFSAVYPALCLPTLPPSRNGWDSPPSVAMWGKRDMARRSSVDDVSPYKGQVDPHSELLMTSCAFVV